MMLSVGTTASMVYAYALTHHSRSLGILVLDLEWISRRACDVRTLVLSAT